jgi:outer membrane protein assembly factor BamA
VSSRRIFPFFLVLLSCVFAFSENPAKANLSNKLLSVHVKGLNHYREDQIISAAGLRLGQLATEDDFKKAIAKLGDTGLFTDVAYSYHYSSAGCDLELQLAENDKLAPILFDNFVWFSDDELIGLLRSRVPLFEGTLPLGGNFADRVAEALNSILRERKIAGQVEYVREADIGGPINGYIYKVNLHSVLIRNSAFPGAAQSEVPALKAAASGLAGKEYLRSTMRPQIKSNLIPVYLARGYLRAAFADPQAKVVQDGAQTVVDVSFPVTPGTQYRLTDLLIGGNRVLTADNLRSQVHLKLGEPADAVQLDHDIEGIQKLYGTKGYLAAQIHAQPAMNDAQATVGYRLSLSEGDLYRMGELQIDGLPEDAAKRMATQWQMKNGDPFDDSYMKRFFGSLYRDVILSRSYSLVPKQTVNHQAKTVAISLHFVPKN